MVENGKIILGDAGFEFEYKNPRRGQNIFFTWSSIKSAEVDVSISGKLGQQFSLILDTQAKVRFSSKDSGSILKKVADYLKAAFRNNDYVCRIGGDEFAILMVEMTTDLQYTIKDKIDSVNQQLSSPEKGIPKVSLSAGVAFSDRENPGENIFEDADKALYKVKENGKNGCGFY